MPKSRLFLRNFCYFGVKIAILVKNMIFIRNVNGEFKCDFLYVIRCAECKNGGLIEQIEHHYGYFGNLG